MPHFVSECSENVVDMISTAELMSAVYEAAEATGLFAKNDVKVRILPDEQSCMCSPIRSQLS